MVWAIILNSAILNLFDIFYPLLSVNRCRGRWKHSIPPQLQIEIKQRKQLITCEHCGRVLVDNELAETVEI